MTIFNELDQARDICQACGADRDVVFKMMFENRRLDNWEYAHKILENCIDCKEAFKKEIQWLSENMP